MMLSSLTFLRASVSGVFQISYGAISPTETRVGFVVLNLLLVFYPPARFKFFGMALDYPDLLSLGWSIMMIATFIVCMTKQVRQLAAREPVARQPSMGLSDKPATSLKPSMGGVATLPVALRVS